MGAYGEHSSRLRNFEGFKLVTNLKETKEAKCKFSYTATDLQFSSFLNLSLYIDSFIYLFIYLFILDINSRL